MHIKASEKKIVCVCAGYKKYPRNKHIYTNYYLLAPTKINKIKN